MPVAASETVFFWTVFPAEPPQSGCDRELMSYKLCK